MTTAPGLAIRPSTLNGVIPQASAIVLGRAFVLVTLFAIVFLPEFARDGTSTTGVSVYAKVAGGFRFIDLAILFIAFCHLVGHGCLRRQTLRFPRNLAGPGIAFLACIAIAAYYGSTRGGSNLFFDWRGLALGIALYLVWSFWLQTTDDVAIAVRVFALYLGLRIAFLYLQYAAGYRDNLLGVEIPILRRTRNFVHCIRRPPGLELSAERHQSSGKVRLVQPGPGRLSDGLPLLPPYLLGELAVGTFLSADAGTPSSSPRRSDRGYVDGRSLRHRRILIPSRIQSLDVTSDDNEFSADNADHLLDLVDAWDEVRQSPVMGIGLGTSYPHLAHQELEDRFGDGAQRSAACLAEVWHGRSALLSVVPSRSASLALPQARAPTSRHVSCVPPSLI